MATTITINIPPYNRRRYSKPWGARITFAGAKAEYDFSAGTYLGDDSGGKIIISCNPGEVIAHGQRDNRGNGTTNSWYVVNDDGGTTTTDKAGAFAHWQAAHS